MTCRIPASTAVVAALLGLCGPTAGARAGSLGPSQHGWHSPQLAPAAIRNSGVVSALDSNPRLFQTTHGFHSFAPNLVVPPLSATKVYSLDGAAANIGFYEQAAQARNVNPVRFDQLQPLVGRFLSDPRFASFVQAQLVRDPSKLFLYSPVLASLAKGREQLIVLARAHAGTDVNSLSLYSQEVQARNANPVVFDRQNPFIGRVLSDPKFASYVQAQLDNNPNSYFQYSSVLERLLRGRAEWIALAPTITPPTHVPVPTGPTAVPAPPGLVLLSLGMVSVLGVWCSRLLRNTPTPQRA